MRESDRCEFSEFSFGYAFVDNAIHSNAWGAIAGAPRFLSQNAEGNVDGGFDVELPFKAVPLFLQFKIPQVVRRRSSRMPSWITPPYFRMHLRSRKTNLSGQTQHDQLIELEKKKPYCVYYITPTFWSSHDLERYYLNKKVAEQSEGFSPLAIGELSQEEHCIAYQAGLTEYEVQSEPRKQDRGRYNFESLIRLLEGRIKQVPEATPIEWLEQTTYDLLETLSVSHTRLALPSIETPKLMWQEAIDRDDAEGSKAARPPKIRKSVRFKNRLKKLEMLATSRLNSRLLVVFSQ